ncbi:uncharacterized protein CANTADRAFT_5606 [Suhomyces tanzawaensis NRRL Y-17324]|uniref:Bromodomain associated domain-containing protein n=1 Tax=Suhomyces tanzawaensis NRRL Y-17324 TaxID=984487 RepID=A0A1E4SK86_9ASCO|nr:uncharacterized protein CANTADRAFT_5606 [Suhomyces tanzawaensis NRRL Y-17324]ODV79914.1 hypothetical protein CANTADRAFT_5606 [Suhomyces tanzawaensis NRRL Y-17324]
MDDSFHFALLRISIAQILKANGFEKCKPSTLNALTDIYIHYLDRLVKQSTRLSQLRKRSNDVEIQDITEAMKLTGVIKPENYLQLDDTKDSERQNASSLTKKSKAAYNTKSLDSFRDWVKYSDSFRVSRKLNELPSNLIKNLMEKRKLVLDDGETDQEKKKKKYKERQDYYNQLKLNDVLGHSTSNNMINGEDMDDDENDAISEKDKLFWLNYLIEKDLKLGHDLKFINTTLYDEFLKFQTNPKFHPVMKNSTSNPNEVADKYQQLKQQVNNVNKYDYLVISIEDDTNGDAGANGEDVDPATTVRPSAELEKILPYNLKYEKYLLEDDLEQFVGNEHKDTDSDDKPGLEPRDDSFSVNDDGIGGDNTLMFM